MKFLARADSLDLLLDAMCNMLGGVIFLALFAALLLSVPEPEQVRETAATERSEQELLMSMTALRERGDLLRALQPEHEAVAETATERQLLDACGQVEKEYRALLAELHRRRSEHERAGRERRQHEEFQQRTPAERERELARLRNANAQLRREIAALPAKPWVFAPGSRSELAPWRLILADGRLYRLGDNAAVRGGGSEEVRTEAVRYAGREYWMLRLEPGKGVLREDFDWRAWSEAVPRDRYFVELLTFPGDIAGAAAVREEVRRLGFRQNWRVRSPETLALAARKEGVYEAGR